MNRTQTHPWRQSVKAHKTKQERIQLHPHLTCPTCKTPYALTSEEARKGYQCMDCTQLEEFGV